MTVQLFGVGSSPGCSNFALKRTAEDGEREFGARATETLRKNFYLDDALRSAPTEKDPLGLVQAVKDRVVTKISSCRVNTTSRRGIKRLGISFGSIFLLFSNKSSRGPLS